VDPGQWQTNSWGDVEATFRWIHTGHTGERSLRTEVISGSEGDAKWWSVPFALQDAKYQYTASVWYRSTVTTKFAIRAQNDDDSQVEWLFAKEIVPPSEEWSFAIGVVDVPYWATKVSVMLVIESPGWVESDDYALVAGAQSIDTDVVEQQDVIESVDVQMPPDWSPPRVSIVFDDGWVSAVEQAVPIMEKYGFTATWFVIADYVDKAGYQADYATSKQLEELQDAGHEIASHTFDHPNLSQLTSAEVEEQLTSSKARLEQFGLDIVGFAPPGGLLNPVDLPLVKQHYQYMRMLQTGVNGDDMDPYGLKCLVVSNVTSLTEVRAWVEQAGVEDAWLILLYHRMGAVAVHDTYVTPTQFQSVMQLLADVEARVRPMGEILGVWTPAEPKPPVGDISLPPVTFDGSSWIAEPGDTPNPTPGSSKGSGGCQSGAVPQGGTVWLLAALVVLLRRRWWWLGV